MTAPNKIVCPPCRWLLVFVCGCQPPRCRKRAWPGDAKCNEARQAQQIQPIAPTT